MAAVFWDAGAPSRGRLFVMVVVVVVMVVVVVVMVVMSTLR